MSERPWTDRSPWYREGYEDWCAAGTDARNPYESDRLAKLAWQEGYDAARERELRLTPKPKR